MKTDTRISTATKAVVRGSNRSSGNMRLHGCGILLLSCVAAGFSDQSHLTRHFKRLVGVTPRRFA